MPGSQVRVFNSHNKVLQGRLTLVVVGGTAVASSVPLPPAATGGAAATAVPSSAFLRFGSACPSAASPSFTAAVASCSLPLPASSPARVVVVEANFSPPPPGFKSLALLRAHLRLSPSSQYFLFSACLASDQVRMATTDKSRLYSWTGLRKTGAVPVPLEEGGAAKRIEVVDSVWTTKPSGTAGCCCSRPSSVRVRVLGQLEFCLRATTSPECSSLTHAVRPASRPPSPSLADWSPRSQRAPFVLPSCGKRSKERSSEQAVESSSCCE